MSTTEQLVDERDADYGTFRSNALLIRALQKAFAEYSTVELDDVQLHAVNMVFMKLGRIGSAPAYHEDSWRDVSGYAECVLRTKKESTLGETGTEGRLE